MPIALVAPEQHLTVVPVCGARTLAEGLPPMGIACAQQDVAHVYPLPDDPEAALTDFVERAADHARRMAERLDAQERSRPALPGAQRRRLPASGLVSRRRVLAQRRRLLTIAVPATVLVLVVGFFVARWLTTENRERDAVFTLLRARGGAATSAASSTASTAATPPAPRRSRAFLPRVTGAGAVKIARLDSGTSYSFGDKTGTTRVVWVHGVDAPADRPVRGRPARTGAR